MTSPFCASHAFKGWDSLRPRDPPQARLASSSSQTCWETTEYDSSQKVAVKYLGHLNVYQNCVRTVPPSVVNTRLSSKSPFV